MDTTRSLLDALKIKLNLRSDYALAKYLGVTTVTMSRWREGKNFGDGNAVRVADLLGLSRAYVVACMHAQSAEQDTETSGVWRQIADVFRDKVALWACATLLGFAAFFQSQSVSAADFLASNNIHYAKYRRGAARRRRTLKSGAGNPGTDSGVCGASLCLC